MIGAIPRATTMPMWLGVRHEHTTRVMAALIAVVVVLLCGLPVALLSASSSPADPDTNRHANTHTQTHTHHLVHVVIRVFILILIHHSCRLCCRCGKYTSVSIQQHREDPSVAGCSLASCPLQASLSYPIARTHPGYRLQKW